MKAIVVEQFGEPDVLQLRERPTPRPGPGQVLVRLAAAGVNPVETYIRTGSYAVKPDLPYTPGTDGAGTVEASGGAAGVHPGDRVYLSGSVTGTYAEFALCQAADVHPLPDRLTFAQGAGIGVPYGAAYRALVQRGGGRAGETLLVHGASGSVGIAAVQIGKALGLRVLGTAGSPEGLRRVREEGAEEAFDHHDLGYLEKIAAATGGQGADLILEMLANVNLPNDFELAARRRRIVIVGTRGKVEIDPRRLLLKEADIRGMSLPKASPEELRAIHAALGAGLASGVLRPLVGKEFPLSQAAEAHRAVMKSGSTGKIALIP